MIEAGLAAARWLQFAAAVLLCGAPAFCLYALTPSMLVREGVWLKRLWLGALSAAAVAALLTLLAESAEMSGGVASAIDPATIWSVAAGTYFGTVWFVRLALLLVLSTFAVRFGRSSLDGYLFASLGTVFAASLAWQGHGGEGAGMLGPMHRIADVVHMLAASVWIGALVVLTHLVNRGRAGADEAQAAHAALVRFSGVGPFVVAALILTGVMNTWALTAPRPWVAAIASPYAWVLALKLALFAGMLGLAALNRLALTPRLQAALANGGLEGAISNARRSVLIETVLAFFVLAAVSALGVMEPPSAG